MPVPQRRAECGEDGARDGVMPEVILRDATAPPPPARRPATLRTASIVPSGATASATRPGARRSMPWLCSELTGSSVVPARRCSQDPATRRTVCALPVRTRASGCIGVEWSSRPGTSCRRWCSVPPSATFSSCRPRQMASTGTPRATASRISGRVMRSRFSSSGVPSAWAGPPYCAGWTLLRLPVRMMPSSRASRASTSAASPLAGSRMGIASTTWSTART